MELDDEILALTGDLPISSVKSSSSARGKRTRNGDDEYQDDRQSENSDDDDGDYSKLPFADDPEWLEVQQWDADFMGDAADRRMISQLSELDREILLADRKSKAEVFKEKMYLQQRLSSTRTDGRKGRKSSTNLQKDEALRKMKRDRERKKDVASSGNIRDYASDEDNVEAERDRAHSQQPQISLRYEDVLPVLLSRDELEKWVYLDFFEETVKGCFVRVSIGFDAEAKEKVYRFAQVLNVAESSRIYKFGTSMVKKSLTLSVGRAVRDFKMDIISNSKPNQAEFDRYLKTCIAEKVKVPGLQEIRRKSVAVEEARAYRITNEDIGRMVAKKKAIIQNPVNVAAEKLQLKQKIQMARDANDTSLLNELEIALAKIEERTQLARLATEKQDAFASLNEKNRKNNFSEAREAEKMAAEQRRAKGAADYDPFARRKTNTQHFVRISTDAKDLLPPSSQPTVNSLTPSASPLTPGFQFKKPVAQMSGKKGPLSCDDYLSALDIDSLEMELTVDDD